MFDWIDSSYVFYAALVGAVLAIAESFYLLTFASNDHRRVMNRRLSVFENGESRGDAILTLRRERGLGALDSRLKIATWFNRLMMQSGVTVSIWKLAGIFAAAGAFLFAGLSLRYGLIAGAVVGPVVAIFGPFIYLVRSRKKRLIRFTDQLPEALDILVRSLRAGHPVPAAIKMVGREMADPLGSEFGIAEDEITYGLDIETAMRNMLDRVGQEDLPLFVTSVAIQSSSGGNLTEILDNLTGVVRLRIKMRRKIRALSAEGRISALILSSVPILLFIIINWMAPTFYGANWSHPWMIWGLAGAATWMVIGNLVMHKMINFRF